MAITHVMPVQIVAGANTVEQEGAVGCVQPKLILQSTLFVVQLKPQPKKLRII